MRSIAIATHIEGNGPDVVLLMERLESIEPYRDDVVGVVEKAEMHDGELLTVVAHTEQVPRAVVGGASAQDAEWFVLLVDAIDGDADLKALVVALICASRETMSDLGVAAWTEHSPSLLSVTSLAMSHICCE